MKKVFLPIILIFVLTILLNIRTDGFFPFNSKSSELFIYLSSLSVIIFSAIVLILSFINKFKFELNQKLLISLPPIFFLSNLAFYAILSVRNNQNFPRINNLNIPLLILASIILSAFFLYFYQKKNTKKLLITLFISFVVLSFVQILYFPITAKIGDLMPILQSQGEAFLKGENIYQFYILDNGISTQAVRQPGNVIAYLPGVFLNIDLRFISLIYLSLSFFLFFKILYKKGEKLVFDRKFLLLLSLLILFFLFPYRLIRIDLYEPPFWFLFTLSIYLLQTKRYFFNSIVWGIGIFTQVWFWLFTPFLIVFLFKKLKFKSLKFIIISLILGGALLGIFIFRDSSAYFYHAFGYYDGVVKDGIYYLNNFYLTPLFHIFGVDRFLTIVQFASVGVVGLLSLKYIRSLRSLIAFFAIAFFVFIQFNSLTWNYFYINLIFLLSIWFLIQEN